MTKVEIRREALNRQGTALKSGGSTVRVLGDQRAANFDAGSEGLVHFAIDERTRVEYRIKCFWEPTPARRRRSELLVKQQLATITKRAADALGGAPFALLDNLGPATPFAVVMKSVRGFSWARLREQAEADADYPPKGWPPVQVRAIWAYGLATAIKNLEARQFVHADLSPGNVIVTPGGETAGDMALVDFDAFIDLANGELESSVRGSTGYAAPEIWDGRRGSVGSDRIGMGILIQEFLCVGDPGISRQEAFGWAYDQDAEIVSRRGDPHPLFAKKYPELAELLVATLRTADAAKRPAPDVWREALVAIIDGRPASPPLRGVVIEGEAVNDPAARISFADSAIKLDLETTPYGIRATLERLPNGVVRVVVHGGAEVRIRRAGSSRWETYRANQAITVKPGLVLFDSRGKLSARIDGRA